MSLQNWTPDTCPAPGCKFEQSVTDGVITLSRVLRKCSAHAALTDAECYAAVYADVASDQKRKNGIEGLLRGNDVRFDFGLTTTRADGGREYKAGVAYRWSFTGTGNDRVLTIAIDGKTLTEIQKAAIRAECVSRYGVGKVVVE